MHRDVNITSRWVTQEIGAHISKSKQSLSVVPGGPVYSLAVLSLEKAEVPRMLLVFCSVQKLWCLELLLDYLYPGQRAQVRSTWASKRCLELGPCIQCCAKL